MIAKIYVTKYTLTSGKIDVHKKAEIDGDMATVRGKHTQYFHGKEWQTTEATARLRVMAMQDAKRKSIAKQLAKLDAMKVDLNDV